MNTELYQQLFHFGAIVAGTAIAGVTVAAIAPAARCGLAWLTRLPLEPTVAIADYARSPTTISLPEWPVNIDYLARNGKLMDLGRLKVTIQNSKGGLYPLHEGVFVGCPPACIFAGARVRISVQGGKVKELLQVKLDPSTGSLYVKSNFTRQEMIHYVNGTMEPSEKET